MHRQGARPPERSYLADAALGVRLALADRRSLVRAVFVTIGVAVSGLILLIVASVPHAVDALTGRENARSIAAARSQPTGASGELEVFPISDRFQAKDIEGVAVVDASAASSAPPGVDRLPGPGQYVVSPALKRLLESKAGTLLRPRYDGRVIGVIGKAGLAGPDDLYVYTGVSADQVGAGDAPGYLTEWGRPGDDGPTAALIGLVVSGAAAVVLVPPLTFVAMAGRLASGSRDRRLAAMRLVGLTASQARRVAAGETLPASIFGAMTGLGVFFGARPLVPDIQLGPTAFYTSDIAPGATLTVLIVLALPLLTVAAALFGLRGVIVEPLGIARHGGHKRRRIAWRLAILAIGAAGLVALTLNPTRATTGGGSALLAISTIAALIAIPLLVPVVVDLVAGHLPTGNATAWTLGVRRLQSDTESQARIVSMVAVSLAGVILLQGMLSWVRDMSSQRDAGAGAESLVTVNLPSGSAITDMADGLRGLNDVQRVGTAATIFLDWDGRSGTAEPLQVLYADCTTIELVTTTTSCEDGQAYAITEMRDNDGAPGHDSTLPPAGTAVRIAASPFNQSEPGTIALSPLIGSSFTMPVTTRTHPATSPASFAYAGPGTIYLTPGALPYSAQEVDSASSWATITMRINTNDPDTIERIRNRIAQTGVLSAHVRSDLEGHGNSVAATLTTVQTALIVVALVIITLASGALIVAAADQVSERRGIFAYLAAIGVPRWVLAKSVIYAASLPALASIVLASAGGAALTWVLIRLANTTGAVPLRWGQISTLAGIAALLVLVAITTTLPAVRAATRPERIRND